MRNIKLVIAYDGTDYAGWQVQPNQKTIQDTIQKALKRILNEEVKLKAVGRTDAGVHAKAQAANFKTNSKITLKGLKRALNSILPDDILIEKINLVSDSFNARFNAISKIYRYQIIEKQPKPFNRLYFSYVPYKLNEKLIAKEAGILVGRHDFASFQGSNRKAKDTRRAIKSIKVLKKGNSVLIDIEADGFLNNMARNIVGTLIEVGRGKFPPGSLKTILKAKDRKKAGPTAEAKGLFLVKVKF